MSHESLKRQESPEDRESPEHHEEPDEIEGRVRSELLDVVTALAPRLPADVVTRSRRALDAVSARIGLGLDHRVVALVGGTGSGKSSLFNAVSGLDVADVGVVRPTTSLPTACVWGSDATALLDHLGVPRERRHRGEAALSGPEPGQLDGIVLLDVPDHDSIAAGHRDEVDRLVPLVDLLVWVLDPQKYADNRLHADYLTALRGRQDGMLVVLNQVDTLTPDGLAELRLDVARLLVAEGLGSLEVVSTSARTGEGVTALRAALRRVSEGASRNRAAVRESLDGVSHLLAQGLGPAPRDGLDVGAAADRLADAVGVGAVADSLAAAVRGGVAIADVRDAPVERMAAVRSEWLEAQAAGLAPAWRAAVDAAIPSAREIGEAAAGAVRQVPVPVAGRAGLLTRLRPAVLARVADEARVGYLAAARGALQARVHELLAPSQEVRGVLTRALATVDPEHVPAVPSPPS